MPVDRARLREIAERAKGCQVLVLGDLMLDRYVRGSVGRISPEAPVPVVLVEDEWDALGGAGNVAANVRALGAECRLLGLVGTDEAAGRIESLLDGLGVRHDLVPDPARQTPTKTRVVAQGQQVVRVDRERTGPLGPAVGDRLRVRAEAAVTEADVVVLQDYDKGTLAPELIRTVLDQARDLGVLTLVDPKWQNFFAYSGADVFKPNERELASALGEPVHAGDGPWLEAVRRTLECEHLIVTLGAAGMAVASAGKNASQVHTAARSVYDVSGAGDIVSAVVAIAMGVEAAVDEAVLIATHAAAVGVAKAGVATVTWDEIWDSMSD